MSIPEDTPNSPELRLEDVKFTWVSVPLVPFDHSRWPVQEMAYKCEAERHALRHGPVDISAYPDAVFLELFREMGSKRVLRFWTACQDCHDDMLSSMGQP